MQNIKESVVNKPCIDNIVNDKEVINNVEPWKENNKAPMVEIIGDSHLTNIVPKGISNKKNVVMRSHPGSTSEDLKSFITPSIKKNCDVIVILVVMI